MLLFGLFVVSAIAFLYFVLPRSPAWGRPGTGSRRATRPGSRPPSASRSLSFGGYIVLFRTVFTRGETRIEWRESYQITMAGLAATRLFATAGAGGVVLTAWALRRSGMSRRIVACRMIAFLSLLYAVYMSHARDRRPRPADRPVRGSAPFALTVIPAIFGAVDDRDLPRAGARAGGLRAPARGAGPPAGAGGASALGARGWPRCRLAATGVRTALRLVRARDPGLLGAIAWWYFDIGVLWACFHAFGDAPPFPVIVMAYFIGQLGNVLPLPGGIGGVDGGLIGAFIAFGVDSGLAVVAVLAYRAFSFWLPTIPGRDRLSSAAQDRQGLEHRGAQARPGTRLTTSLL